MNQSLGKVLSLRFTGNMNCINCNRSIKKTFQQGFCFPCTQRLACCDICIVRPELCHFHKGTCREPEWGKTHCLQKHYVYLSNSSNLKVGITRGTQLPTRWIDQGATQGLAMFTVKSRLISGLLEHAFKEFVNDKTNWRTMLKGKALGMDLAARRDELLVAIEPCILDIKQQHGDDAIILLEDEKQLEINYPILEYPVKVTSLNFDKNPHIESTLQGIKGQYLIFDDGVINMRKFAGYEVEINEC